MTDSPPYATFFGFTLFRGQSQTEVEIHFVMVGLGQFVAGLKERWCKDAFPKRRMSRPTLILTVSALAVSARADVHLPAIFSDHMVLQQKLENPVWGWDNPGAKVTVVFAGQTKTAEADATGRWSLKLDAVPANATGATLAVKGSSERVFQDVLVGEVWICSGQSNMGFTVAGAWDGDLEIASAKFPKIRLLNVPRVGTQEPKDDFKGQWSVCSPETVGGFSAVGFFYGRLLHQTLDVPVGLINNAWGGSAAEAWVRRDVLENDPRFKRTMEGWVKREGDLQTPKAREDFEKKTAAWKQRAADAKTKGVPFTERAPEGPEATLAGNARPGNIYNGVLRPTIGYGIKGAIWYQGESNAGRAYEHASLFPLLINHWRAEWKQGDFPFYWVQLADYMAEKPEPGESAWAELRETQTKTQQAVKNGGQAVIIDLGEANDIHPHNKRDVAERLARIALARDYGFKIPYRSPEFASATFEGGKALVKLDTFGSSLRTVDVAEVKGCAVCGEDRKWVWAEAKIVDKTTLQVSAKSVEKPVAVRYAWADNPVCNLYSAEGLPVTPFRSDDFPMTTQPKP